VKRVHQIGFLGKIGELPVRDHANALTSWGIRPINEICVYVEHELVYAMEHLMGVLDSLPG
jgi:hypothetical protein